ncbi:uncharacterized protein LOC127808772 isoform X2 [Diospyros lotus]|uniref:uncharacterized protein LOC127808772 isoform X2 n=1 Tax=Diospyros lotus TaxID=55363 RepID=UPI0022503534|nr:uncharacterized protein LOC127808772 isoform X2 [Diospyros lotus]
MPGHLRDQALSLLAQANNHGDLAVKLSSLKQAKDILAAAGPSIAPELFPYLAELQYSPEALVRKSLIEVLEEIGLKAMGHSSILMPVLLALLKDNNSAVARQSIVSGTNFFCSILEELSLQFHQHGIVERWLEELWTWMIKFKDAVYGILWQAASDATKLLALKFLETCVLLFTPDSNESEKPTPEVMTRHWAFNVSWLDGGHPVLNPVALTSEANRSIAILLNLLRSASSLSGSLTICVINCLSTIARKRPLHYDSILSAFLDFEPNYEAARGCHMASVHYSIRTAFLGFLRCTFPAILESRDRLLGALRGMNAGDAADQVIRQVDKMIKNSERASRDARLSRDDQASSQVPVGGDTIRKRPMPVENEEPNNAHDMASKRIHHGPNTHSDLPIQNSDSGWDYTANGVSSKVSLLDSGLSPVEQMIAVISALIAEGERGAKSLEILISEIQPDLLADIVMVNMWHLPKSCPPLLRHYGLPVTSQSGSSGPPSVDVPIGSPSVQSPVQTLSSSSNAVCMVVPELSTSSNLPAEPKRDPRRDPRRLDPRRAAVSVEVPQMLHVDDTEDMQSEIASSLVTTVETTSGSFLPKIDDDAQKLESPVVSRCNQLDPVEEKVLEVASQENAPAVEVDEPLLSPVHRTDEDLAESRLSDISTPDDSHKSSALQADELSPAASEMNILEEACPDLPVLPLYVDLTEEQQRNVRKLATERIIYAYKPLQGADCSQTRIALLARLVAQCDADDDMVGMIQKHIVSEYQLQKGHELAMHVLYHLHSLMVSDSVELSSFAAIAYEKFLLGVAKSLLDALPATDKSFSRLLGEVPLLPDSALKLLDNLCCSDYQCGKDGRDGDHVTQGLGAVWSLVLGRPLNRQACLDIALKCAIHPHDDIRSKAIRLVANKLYVLNYISTDIEQFAMKMFLSAVEQRISDAELPQSVSAEQRTEWERGRQETSISGSQLSEPGTSENDLKGEQSDMQSDSPVSFSEAQRLVSLFFALCIKNPRRLQLVFENYTRAPKAVKQAIHRHIPSLTRSLGSSYSELLRIISDPPQGSENLLKQVLSILSEGTPPSADLIDTVKHLYETKMKDATILIPMLSSFSKTEVLPIFPRLVDLPLDKFQTALAHILQGSAHTGPALTPAEVLVAIHGITPEKDGLALKKITDACSACFEQRTVFTQQVLAKALNQMVDQTPLPLLFMRTVIQAIDAFPALVDFVMEILSKLVSKQIWRMPKLWVGFLKCVSQTQPHSFHVLLQLPPPQLESALNKYASLRGPLAAYASQRPIRTSLPRSVLVLLGLANESQMQESRVPSALHASETSSSVHGATLT